MSTVAWIGTAIAVGLLVFLVGSAIWVRTCRRKAPVVPRVAVSYYGPGEHCTTAVHGDVILVRHAGVVPWLIRFFQRLRNWGKKAPYAEVNHAMTVLSDGPTAVVQQMQGGGGKVVPLRGYVHLWYAVVHTIDATTAQRQAAVAVARWYVGVPYGFPSILADALYLTTGIPLALAMGQSAVCSTDAAGAQRCMGLIPDKSDVAVRPDDMARYYDVRLPLKRAA